jgi:hypothetical protein
MYLLGARHCDGCFTSFWPHSSLGAYILSEEGMEKSGQAWVADCRCVVREEMYPAGLAGIPVPEAGQTMVQDLGLPLTATPITLHAQHSSLFPITGSFPSFLQHSCHSFFFLVLELELRASCLLGRLFTT